MLKIGITGGIGSGKSTVCQVFETLGIPVFSADTAAKHLMEEDPQLRQGIINLLGEEAYINGVLNRAFISKAVFENKEKLQALNTLSHPAVIQYGDRWMTQQTSPYVIKEAAIFFESSTHHSVDIMIGISAPLDLRLKRAMQRNSSTEADIRARMAQQMDEDLKMSRCDYIILNDEQHSVIDQVCALHLQLLLKAKTKQ